MPTTTLALDHRTTLELPAALTRGAGSPSWRRWTDPLLRRRSGGTPLVDDAAAEDAMQVGERLVVETRTDWHAWLDEHHARRAEIWLVSYRRSATSRSLAHAAACEEALCYGWMAGPTAMLDGDSYATRFAPRAPASSWSDLDLARARRLARAGRLWPAGIAALPRQLRQDLMFEPGRRR